MMTGEYDNAIEAQEETLSRNTLILLSHERLAAIYGLKGELEKAREHASKVLEIKTDFTIEGWSKFLNYKRREDLDRELNALRQAGLPE